MRGVSLSKSRDHDDAVERCTRFSAVRLTACGADYDSPGDMNIIMFSVARASSPAILVQVYTRIGISVNNKSKSLPSPAFINTQVRFLE